MRKNSAVLEATELPLLRTCQSLTSERTTRHTESEGSEVHLTQQYLYVVEDELFLHRFIIMKVYKLKLLVWSITALYEVFGDTGKV